MTFTPKEVILGATLPLENGSTITFSIAGHVEAERDYDDAVVIFGRKLLKYTNCATDADRLTVRQVISSITSTPLDKVPDVGAATPAPEPAKTTPSVTLDQVSPLPERMPAPTPAEQAAAAVARIIKPPATAPKEPAPSAPPEGFSLCAECGEAVPANQAKLSNLFMNKTLCKTCMDKSQGVS
ncbi:MAG TPA: hypothetical protein PLA39_08955 [Methanoculleus sp.]|nr:hypothetical protein [Methanoculleus sp.]